MRHELFWAKRRRRRHMEKTMEVEGQKTVELLARACRAAGLVWSRPGSICVFLSPLYRLRQGFSSPEVMMASFLAEIWKEQEILWLSSERWLYYWDATNKGWCRPGIPRLALSVSFLPIWSLSFWLSLHLPLSLREGLQYSGAHQENTSISNREDTTK